MLVATDVASRGIDIPDLSLIIQIEPPQDINSYIHRAGRTARAGKMGTCITFYNLTTTTSSIRSDRSLMLTCK